MINKSHLPLCLVLLLGFTLRFWNLQGLPVGFASDEVMNGYVGRYILQNGVDLYGNRWPILYFDHFGDYPNVIPMYLSGLFTYIFGVNEFAVRFPIALAGSLTVLLIYLLGRWLWKPKLPALIAAFILAVMPWHIILSRATAEGITASFVFFAGLFLVFKGIDANKWKKIFSGWLLLFSTYLLYPGFRVFVPLVFIPAFFLAQKHQKNLVTILIAILFVTTFFISQTIWGKGRFDQTSILTYNNFIHGKAVNYSIGIGEGKILQARIFSNKFILATREFARQYFEYFSPSFLTGEKTNPTRYFIPEHGVIYWSFVLLLLGTVIKHFISPWSKQYFMKIFKYGREKYFLWLMWILLVAPVPASLTLEDVPNVHRTVIMATLLSPLIGISAFLAKDIKIFGKKMFLQFFILLTLFESIYFWHYYANLHSVVATAYRNDKQRTLASWMITHINEYENVYAPSGEALQIHYLFQSKDFSSLLSGKFKLGLKIDNIDNITFIDNDCPSDQQRTATSSSLVFIDKSQCAIKPGFQEISSIKRLDSLDAYRIVVPTL